MAEMCCISQLFHENVCAVSFAFNMMNVDFPCVNSLTNCCFAKIEMLHVRSHGTLSPLDATLIVIETIYAI